MHPCTSPRRRCGLPGDPLPVAADRGVPDGGHGTATGPPAAPPAPDRAPAKTPRCGRPTAPQPSGRRGPSRTSTPPRQPGTSAPRYWAVPGPGVWRYGRPLHRRVPARRHGGHRPPRSPRLRADSHGAITDLVAHEYIVPVDAWTAPSPPNLVGVDFHRHPTLPLWVLHTWIWKDNADGVFADWNPAVRQCPAGVPIFGIDLPK